MNIVVKVIRFLFCVAICWCIWYTFNNPPKVKEKQQVINKNV